ncbi:MAG: ectonucleotide pyrophosphatase/phosphodiesterase [Bacillota bacterium]|nr:ectonucleotide pyrophosphatase/phosphodiesterase [Bacillota bacterium]
MPAKRLIVISMDAMVGEDLEYLKEMDNFKMLMQNCARINKVRTIYPSNTYPVHVSIMTGAYPNKTGVTANEEFIVGERRLPWNWFSNVIKTQTIFDYAKKAGLKTASVFWPVTGNLKSVDYLVDEYWSQGPDDSFEDVFRRSGSSEEVMNKAVIHNLPLLVERKHPKADRFVFACACDMIKEFKPDLLMLHPANVDGARHDTGLFTESVTESLCWCDKWLGDIIKATKDAGVYDETNFVVLSDHGQLEIRRMVKPNVIFRENGLIRTDKNGKITDWDAYMLAGGLSAYIYLKDPSNRKVYDKVKNLLYTMKDQEVYGFSEVFTTEEINEKEHLSGDFSFVLETDGYTSFGNGWQRPYVRDTNPGEYHFAHGSHGHHPDKGPQPIFLAMGPDFKAGAELERRPIVDEAPTFAKILGFDMPTADGKPLVELLK